MFLERIRERNIKVIASFVFGFDHDQKDVLGRTVQFAKSNAIEEAEFHILTPYPKTRLAERLEAEGRLLTRNFSKYSSSSVVYEPANMTPEELYEGYNWAWKEFYPEETHEMTEDGFVIKTYAGFPLNTDDLDSFSGAKWVDSVRKKNATEARA